MLFASDSEKLLEDQLIEASASKNSLALNTSGNSTDKSSGTFADSKFDWSEVVASAVSDKLDEPSSFVATT